MELKHNEELTNEVLMMIRQSGISVKVGQTDAAVTNFPGVVPLARMAESLGLFKDLERLLPAKARRRRRRMTFSGAFAMTVWMVSRKCAATCWRTLHSARTRRRRPWIAMRRCSHRRVETRA